MNIRIISTCFNKLKKIIVKFFYIFFIKIFLKAKNTKKFYITSINFRLIYILLFIICVWLIQRQ